LDSIIIYSTKSTRDIPDSTGSTFIGKKDNETIEDLFNTNDIPPPAQISEYKKINPTKHLIRISNATKPYILSFAESYNKLWVAHTDTGDHNNNNEDRNKNNTFKASSIPLYGVTNGFYVNKTGDYTLVIEFLPQIWFNQGLTKSALSLAAILTVFFVVRKRIYNKIGG